MIAQQLNCAQNIIGNELSDKNLTKIENKEIYNDNISAKNNNNNNLQNEN